MKISVTDPISPAIERTKFVLFRPFDIGKWFKLGFCAVLVSFRVQPLLLPSCCVAGGWLLAHCDA